MTSSYRTPLLSGNCSVDGAPVEFHLMRCRKFFTRENIVPVFPASADFVHAHPGDVWGHYLLFVFQTSEGKYVEEEPAAGDCLGVDHTSHIIAGSTNAHEWKDISRDIFFEFMNRVRVLLHPSQQNSAPQHLFLDWPDPATGLPINTARGPTPFCDGDAIEQFFSFHSVLVAGAGGGCRMIEHPVFGLNLYPSTGVLVIRDHDVAAVCTMLSSLNGEVIRSACFV